MEPGIGKKTVEAVLQMRIWKVVEVILHCLLAAILKISTSHATSNNCFVEHIGPHSRELGACGGWKGGGGWCSLGLCVRDRKDENGAERTGVRGGCSDIEGSATLIFCHGGCGGGTVPCCTSLITTTITHTYNHAHTHTHTPPVLLSLHALMESSLCAVRYLLLPAKSNLLIFPECLSLTPSAALSPPSLCTILLIGLQTNCLAPCALISNTLV